MESSVQSTRITTVLPPPKSPNPSHILDTCYKKYFLNEIASQEMQSEMKNDILNPYSYRLSQEMKFKVFQRNSNFSKGIRVFRFI